MRRAPKRPRLYTSEEVATLTGRSPISVRIRSQRMAAIGKQFGQKIGRQWLYTEDEIRELAAIPAKRGRSPKAEIDARAAQLKGVPLSELASVAS